MGYDGQLLTPLIEQLEDATQATGHRLAEAMTEHGERLIVANTPVETFHLRESYKREPVDYKAVANLSWAAYAWEGSVFTEVEYAPFVEMGTGLWGPKRKKYKIEPKKPGGVLAFTPYQRMPNGGVILDVQGAPAAGKPVMVRFVMHPGSPGQHMFEIGVELTQSQFDEWSYEPMRLWKQHVEGGPLFTARTRGRLESFRVRG